MSVGKLRIAMFCCLGIGFLGCIVSAIIAASIYKEKPSILAICIIVFFAIILISPIFLFIPYNKIIKVENNKIIAEYGSDESKAKTYSIYHNIATVDSNNKQKIIRQIFFSSLGVKSDNSVNLFYWKNVESITIEDEVIAIKYLDENGNLNCFSFPNKQYFNLLIKTFCNSEIIKDNK